MRKIYNLVKKNNLEKVVENFFSLSALEIVTYGFKLITIPYIAKTIGLEKFGTWGSRCSLVPIPCPTNSLTIE